MSDKRMSEGPAVAYDYEEPYPDPDQRNYWHIYEVGMAGDDEISGTITAPFTPEMGEAIKRIVVAINDAYALARRLRATAVDRSNTTLTES